MRSIATRALRSGVLPITRIRRYATSVSTSPAGTPEPEMTTLSNKIRVITGVSPQHISTVGIVVDAGSRYESERTSGCGHLLDKLALKVCYPLLLLIWVEWGRQQNDIQMNK